MLTSLDYICRRAMDTCDVEKHGNDPRKAMAYVTSQFIHAAQTGIRPFDNLLDEAFYAILAPIVAPFLPAGVTFGFSDGVDSERAFDLILTRQTASLLSAVKSFDASDEHGQTNVSGGVGRPPGTSSGRNSNGNDKAGDIGARESADPH